MKSKSWISLGTVAILSFTPMSAVYAHSTNAHYATVSFKLNGRYIGNPGSVSVVSPTLHKTFQYVPVYYIAHVLKEAGIQSRWHNGMWALQSKGAVVLAPTQRATNRHTAFISINGKPAVAMPKMVRRDKWSGRMTTYVRADRLISLLQKLNLQVTLKNDTLAIVSSNMPKYGGQLQLESANPPTHLDPALATDSASVDLLSQIYDTLVTYNDPSDRLEPSLAESYSVSADGLTYTFHIRKNATFSNGDPVTAQSFVTEFERVLGKGGVVSSGSGYLNPIVAGSAEYAQHKSQSISGVETPDSHTLVIHLTKPEPFFIDLLAMPFFSAVDGAYIAKVGNQAFDVTSTMGSGPFELSVKQGTLYTLTPNPHYWKHDEYGNPLPYLSKINIDVNFNNALEALHFAQGTTGLLGTLTDGIPASFMDTFQNSARLRPTLQKMTENAVYYLGMNAHMAPFDNPKFRLAMEYAVNKQAIVQKVLHGLGKTASQPLPPGMPGYDKNLPSTVDYRYDPNKARELLAAAGYQPGATTVTLTTINDTNSLQTAQEVQSDLQAVGIQTNVQSLTFNQYLKQLVQGKTPFALIAWQEDYPDASDFLNTLFNSNEAPFNNMIDYSDPQVDSWLNQAQTDLNAPARHALYDNVTQQVLQDAAWVPLYYPVGEHAVQPWLHGYYMTQQGVEPFSTMWMDTGKK